MTQTEKPYHYTYLKGFRVEQCAQFLQHKCTNHKPFTCFDWHFMNQRRRRPVKKADGNFNYSPDTYCTKYDETTGICPDKDECPFLHRTAGDTERRYHLRYYKTGICVHDTDSRGHCVKNGQHCAFAHGAHDLRNPVYDIRELQASEMNGNASGGAGGTLASGSNADSADQSCALLLNSGPNSLDRERNALNEDPRWNETAYVLANYKTDVCKRPPRLCRQGYACPQYHNSKDRRRTPKTFKYRSTPCPSVKQGDEWGDPVNCEQGESCPYCHTRTEQQFHPEIYKSSKCNDMQQSGYCPRGPFCAFAHDEKEITATRNINLDMVDTDTMTATTTAHLQQQQHKLQQQLLFKQTDPSCSLVDSIAVESRDSAPDVTSSTTSLNHSQVPGPIARPRSYSQSQAKVSGDYNLHAALAAVRLSMRDDPLSAAAAEQPAAPSPFGVDLWKRDQEPFCAFAHDEKELAPTKSINLDMIDAETLTAATAVHLQQQKLQQQQQLLFESTDPSCSLVDSMAVESRDLAPDDAATSNITLNHSQAPGPIARPRSYSQSQAKVGGDYDLHAALAAVRHSMRDDPMTTAAASEQPTTTTQGPFGIELWKLESVPVSQLLQLRQQLRMDLELLNKLIQRKDHDAWSLRP